jgi:hypothetical protein
MTQSVAASNGSYAFNNLVGQTEAFSLMIKAGTLP